MNIPKVKSNRVDIIGLSVDEAEIILKNECMTLRVINENGIRLKVDKKFMPTRLNVYVENNIITKIGSSG